MRKFHAASRLFLVSTGLAACAAAFAAGTSDKSPQSQVGLGWAKSSINTVKFRHSPLATFKDTEFIAYYDGDCKVIVGKRKLGEDKWELKDTGLTGSKTDAHNTISIAIDGSGIMHLAWDHHNNPLNYVISKEPLSLDLVRSHTDGAAEKSVTYPEFYNLPDGDLMMLFRDGSSGDGRLVLKHYTLATKTWTTVHQILVDNHDATTKGTYNAYWEMCIDAKGTIHLGWVWRGSPDVASNHNICYAKSTDGGKTFTTAAGKELTLPMSQANCETAMVVPTSHDLINQTSIAADADGHAYICTFFKPGNDPITQLMIVHYDGKEWKSTQVGSRKTALNLGGGGTKRLVLSRPLILIDDTQKQAKVNVVFRDVDRGDKISVASTENIDKGEWTFKDLTTDAYGFWEPTCNESLWMRDKVIHLFVQKTDQVDGQDNTVRTGGPDPTPVSVLEWKP